MLIKSAVVNKLSNNKLTILSCNAYPKYVYNSIINIKSNVNRNDNISNSKDNRKVIWINLPYLGKRGKQLTNSLTRKLKRSFNKNNKFKMVYKTHKLSVVCHTKDSVSVEQNLLLFIGLHALVVFKNILVKPIETSSPNSLDLMSKS